jgi:hypothetical protein
MADMDMFAAMGISGFGKKTNQRLLDPMRFEKNRRYEVSESFVHLVFRFSFFLFSSYSYSVHKTKKVEETAVEQGPSDKPVVEPPPSQTEADETGEPEFDPSEGDDDADSEQLFPTTHELILKDHTKVVSALALDPSGARIISGSHDYDCKLWDFGGMDWRCKPFNSWEPAGTYYVSNFGPASLLAVAKYCAGVDTRLEVLQRWTEVPCDFRNYAGKIVRQGW